MDLSIDLAGSFSDPAFSTTIMNQTLTGAPGASSVVLRPSFGSSGNTSIDDVLTPLVPSTADEIVLIEFTGTTTGSVTTTIIPGGGSCTSVQTCGTALDDAPPSTGSSDRKVKKPAMMLGRGAAAASGKKQTRLYKRARMKLTVLRNQARKADAKSRLGVPLAPLQSAIDASLALIPAA